MVYLKSAAGIKVIKEGGRHLARILQQLLKAIKPGTATADLEILADKLIREAGGRPSFKNYPLGNGLFFPTALCVSLNDEVVHGSALPSRVLKSGDIVDLDIGMEWPVNPELRVKLRAPLNPHSKNGGFFTDMCATVPVGKVSREAKELLKVSKKCLEAALKEARPGKTINDIARAVQGLAESHGFGVVRDLVGHGVGYFAHEGPDIFNFEIYEDAPENLVLEPGMVIAIEPMINAGDWRIKMHRNGYTILTRDGSLSAHFEHTVAITAKGAEILTKN